MANVNKKEAASLLSLPSELRNAIYQYIFEPDDTDHPIVVPRKLDPLAISLKLQEPNECANTTPPSNRATRRLHVLRTCKQIHNEAHLLAFSLTPFDLSGDITLPEVFSQRVSCLTVAQLSALRRLTLTARINQLRALNEAWAGIPFGHAGLRLDTLVVVPTRPAVYNTAFAEIVGLNQCHTLAYVVCEALKGLRHVGYLEVRNHGCFNEVVWRLFYRALVYRLWRWGGKSCGMKFRCGDYDGREEDGTGERDCEESQWLRVDLQGGDDGGREVGEEIARLDL